MSIFGIGKDNKKPVKVAEPKVKKTETKAVVKAEAKTVGVSSHIASSILLRPRITEKAGILSQNNNVYTFEVSPRANKALVKKAIEEVYKVVPVKIAIAQIKSARKTLKGRTGFSSSGKKAYVYLKEGDKIEFI